MKELSLDDVISCLDGDGENDEEDDEKDTEPMANINDDKPSTSCANDGKDSNRYHLKTKYLKVKYAEVQLNNAALLNRLYKVKQEISRQERLKRVLLQKLEEHNDPYSGVHLSLPELLSTPKKPPSEAELLAERRRKERKERERLREKARKAAKREALKKAKMEALGYNSESRKPMRIDSDQVYSTSETISIKTENVITLD